MGGAGNELLIVSPYFVPRKEGTRYLVEGVERGVRTAVLTNSLAATDVAAVHTGYARQRRELLRGGVELYEMKRKAGSEEGRSQISLTGSSGASLHTKAMIIDRRWVFIGSMNLDPRSAYLNTEMGVLVESPALAEQVRSQFERATTPELSYHVVLEEQRGAGLVRPRAGPRAPSRARAGRERRPPPRGHAAARAADRLAVVGRTGIMGARLRRKDTT